MVGNICCRFSRDLEGKFELRRYFLGGWSGGLRIFSGGGAGCLGQIRSVCCLKGLVDTLKYPGEHSALLPFKKTTMGGAKIILKTFSG